MATTAPPLDVGTLYERVLRASDDADRILAEMVEEGTRPPANLVSLRAQLLEMEEQLQDVMDIEATADALADAREHGAMLRAEFYKQLDAGQ